MRAGRWWVLGFAVLAAAGAFFATDRDELVRRIEPRPLEAEAVRADLLRVEAQGELGGFVFERRVSLTRFGEHPQQIEVEDGGCAIVGVGAWGAWRVRTPRAGHGTRMSHVGRSRRAGGEEPLTRVAAFCPSERVQGPSVVEVEVGLHSAYGRGDAGGAELILLSGGAIPPPIPNGPLTEVEVEVIERQAVYESAVVNAVVTFFFLLLVGLLVEVSVSRRRISPDGEASLRRLSFSFPSSTRGELAAALERADRGGLPAALDLRAALRRRLDGVHAVTWGAWRAPAQDVEVLRGDVIDRLRRKRDERAADYRSREAGFVVITVVVHHRCELPDFPRVLNRAALGYSLDALLPADPRDLLGVRVLVAPADRAQTIDAERLTALWPELVPLDAVSAPGCPSCQAPPPEVHTDRCLVCSAPRSASARA